MSEPITHLNLDGQSVTITRPAIHGLVLDLAAENGQRIHLRCFRYAEGSINGQPCEMPAPLAVVDVLTHFRNGMEAVREFMVQQPVQAAADLETAGQGVPELLEGLRTSGQEGGAA